MSEKINNENLENVTGGSNLFGQSLHVAVPNIYSGFLPLLSRPSSDNNGVIARITPGAQFYVDTANLAFEPGNTYYFASFNGVRGWVNAALVGLLD